MDNKSTEKINRLQNIKKIIEKYNIEQQEEILGIFQENNDIIINENKNGFFINLTNLDESIIIKLEKYIEYVLLQEKHLMNIESQKKEYEGIF